MTGTVYTPHEDKILRDLFRQGYSFEYISDRLPERTARSVKDRAGTIGLRRAHYEPADWQRHHLARCSAGLVRLQLAAGQYQRKGLVEWRQRHGDAA